MKRVGRREQPVVALALRASRQIREEAQARGWRLVHLWYSGQPTGVQLKGALVDALPDSEEVQTLREQGVPVVRLGKLPHAGDAEVPAILPDHAARGGVAAEHFSGRVFRDVGFVGRDPWSDSLALFEGFRERAEALGMACHLYRWKPDARNDRAQTRAVRREQEFVAWLNEMPKPLGLLATGGWQAAKYCAWAAQAGLSIPSDVAVLSTGVRVDICESTMPTISSIEPDAEGTVSAACDLLDSLMAGGKAPARPILIPPKGVVERESTNVLATPDRTVAAALRYMWDHFDMDLSVQDVADEVGMSGRRLTRRFQSALGRTVVEELRRKRLEELKHLLVSSDILIADLAPQVGFRSVHYLHRAFRDALGLTPAQYRRREQGRSSSR